MALRFDYKVGYFCSIAEFFLEKRKNIYSYPDLRARNLFYSIKIKVCGVFFIFTLIFFQKHSLLVKTRLECPLHSGFVLHNTRAPPTDLDVIKYHTKPVSYLVSELLFMPLVGVPTYFYGLSPTQDEKKS